jgi:disulfide bond formation protein DsbB
MLGAAHAFENFGGLAPCALCLKQRDVYWGAAAFALAALVVIRLRPSIATLACVGLGLVFLLEAGVALYHVAVEQHWVVARCDASALSEITTLPMSGAIEAPKCDQPQWFLFGVTMAGYNAAIALALAVGSFLVARRHA